MKIIFVLLILHAALFNASAQRPDSVNLRRQEVISSLKEKTEYRKYTIKLKPATPDTYGFVILKDNKPLAHKFQNLLQFLPNGLQKKEDAYKIAQWVINEYTRTGHWPNIVPPHILNELNIRSYKLQTK